MEQRQSFKQTVLEQLDIYMQKIILYTNFTPFTNKKPSIDHSLKCKTWNYKTTKKKI